MKKFKEYLIESNVAVGLKASKKETEVDRARARQKELKLDRKERDDDALERGREDIEKARQADFERGQKDRQQKRDKAKADARATPSLKEYLEDGTDELVDEYLKKIPCQKIEKC